MKRLFLLLGLLTLFSSALQLQAANWTASWIGVADAPTANQWIALRKNVSLDQQTKSAQARIAADSKYWLWINGKLVVFEGQLKRGPNPNDTYYDVVDLKPHLEEGENTIAVLLWYFGKHGFSHKSSGKAGILFDANIDGKPLSSDASWKAMLHPAFGNTGDPKPNFRLPESNIRFDAGKNIAGWQGRGFDDSAWPAAIEFGKAPCAPWNQLIERPVPLWKDFGLKDYVNAAELPKVSDGKTIRAKLPYNAQVTPYLKVEGPAGQLIDLRMDNYKGGGPPNVRGEYVTGEGAQEYENLGWMNGHEMHYKIPAGFKIHALKYRETGYNTEFTGTFECDDEFLNRYRQKALRTLYITMRDTYFDCPDRERAQWWGDMVNEMGEAFYALDTRANGLAKKGILELANWQRPDHTIYSPVPAGNWDRELPMQMLNSVGYYGFWTYYQYTGDLETIRAVYPAVKRYLSIWKLGEDGLVVPRKGGWTWGDWGNHKDMTILYNGWYYLALKGQKLMAEALGETADLEPIQKRMQSIEANFNKTFWNGKEYRSPGYKGQTDDRAHALAVLAGLASPEQYKAIREVFKTQEHSSPYMEKYVGEALYVMRLEDDAITRTKKRFKAMTDHPYTTLWEGWGIGKEGYGGGTINHAWCGGALTLLSQYGAGVAPITPGYGSYHVLPQMGPLKRINTVVPSVKGDIGLELNNEADRFSLNLQSPEGTNATVGMPKRDGFAINRVEVNGQCVWEQGSAKTSLEGLRFVEDAEHYLTFNVAPGSWSFTAVFAPQEAGESNVQFKNPRCEYLENPLGIDVIHPRLSWQAQTQTRGWKQLAYQVLVASSEEKLARDEADLWDSGKVMSDRSNHVEYGGVPLDSHTQCFWKVKVWDQNGSVSPWSQTATWSMGLLKPEDWKAQWIGFDQKPEPSPSKRADLQGKDHKVVVEKAMYGVKGDPKRQVDIKQRLQQQVDAGKLLVLANNELAGTDPAQGTKKVLEFVCKVDDWQTSAMVPEDGVWDLTTGQAAKQYLPAPYLRKEFKVAAPITRAMLYATAQGVLELSLNGQRVGDEVFTPGWTDYRKRIYYRTYDVTDLLAQGPNAIGAILGDGWLRGNISCVGQNKYGNKLRLKAQLRIDYADGTSEVIVTDPSWKASYGPILESDMQAGEVYDARREMPGWDRPGYNASAWSSVVGGSAIKPLLQAYPGVPVRPKHELKAVKMTEPKPGTYVFDLGQNFSGWARLKVKGQAGDRVDMIFGEMLKEDGTAYTINLRSARAVDTYFLKGGGEEIWEPKFTFHGFRYVQVTGLREKPAPDAVTGIVLYSDSPEASSFECSNPMVNQIYSNIVWGQRSNYLEVPTDCPQRDERLGWTGDTQVFIRTGCYNQDVAAYFTKWMVDLMDTQNRQGLFGNQAPVFHGHGAAAWACAGIICPWTIWKVYGDTRIIEKNYDAMVRYMDACGKDGLGGRKAHTWGDWLAPAGRPPKELISAAYHAYTTSLMAEMAAALGKLDDATKYNHRFQDIRAHFQKTFVKADGKIESDLQTAYCMALSFDLLTDAQRKQAEEHLVARIKKDNYHLSSGFLGIPILLPTLSDMGRSDLAYRIIQNTTYPSWGYSIDQGATTIWERWNSYSKDRGFGDVKMNSFNHYSLGACGEWMFRSMLGIESGGAGFKKIMMKPELGEGITWARGHYDSMNGRISSDWKVANGQFSWDITVPANTTATVYVPATDAASVTESGKALAGAAGVRVLREEADRVVLEVNSGAYAFSAPRE
ncbi:MAG: family 78 glycoside hydrolase catalytic domain [Akkermansiaceae bacterium]